MIGGLIERLDDVLEVGLRLAPDKVAVIQGSRRVTFRHLEERVNRVANGLRDIGVGCGDRVMLLLPNDIAFVETFLGVIRSGAVVVPANPRQSEAYVRHVAVDSRATLVVAPARRRLEMDELRSVSPSLQRVALVRLDPEECNDRSPLAAHEIDYGEWLAAASPMRPMSTALPTDVCMQPYTSGTTGRAKGVLLNHRGQLDNAEAARQCRLLNADERSVVAVPLFHANALSGTVLPALLAAASIVIVPAFDAVEVLETVVAEGCTFIGGVPAMFRMLLDALPALPGLDLSGVRQISCGSAPVPAHLFDDLQRAFPAARISEGYGLTEGGPVVLASPRLGLSKRGSAGVPLPGVEVRIGPTGEVPDDEVGELWVRNTGVTIGYHNLPEVGADRIDRDGWLRTGDLFRRDADGYYFYVGREDDMINSGGENVYPKEVENLLLEHPGIRDACVVGLPHPVKGEVPVAFVALAPGTDLDPDAVKRFALQHGAAHAHPRFVEVLDALPLTTAGKPDRPSLTARALEVFRARDRS